jgi:hypothetical protein
VDCSTKAGLTTTTDKEIVMATISLPQSTLGAFQPISATAVHVLARLAARRAVTAELRAQGVRVSLVKPAEISAKAQVYLQAHPELYVAALERAKHMTAAGVFGKRAQRAYLNNSVQKQNEPKSIGSTVHISGSK